MAGSRVNIITFANYLIVMVGNWFGPRDSAATIYSKAERSALLSNGCYRRDLRGKAAALGVFTAMLSGFSRQCAEEGNGGYLGRDYIRWRW